MEGRVALTPSQALELVRAGHTVLIQAKAGVNVDFPDAMYRKSGAKVIVSTRDVIGQAELIVKVKEPTLAEVGLMRPGQLFFGFLHLAAIPATLKLILKRKITALGYETVRLQDGSLPLLKPMSEIAGKLASQNGAHFLRSDQGGRGVLLGGTERVKPARVLILGGGVVGVNAARIALGLGAHTTILDVSEEKLASIRLISACMSCDFGLSSPDLIAQQVAQADLLIGAALIPGARAPRLVTRTMVKAMKKGAVIVDVAVDQGGCVETSVVTSHKKPIVIRHGVLHYGVPNMPGVVPVTATHALTTESFPYIKALADLGLTGVLKQFPEMTGAVNCRDGEIVHPGLMVEHC